jgi:hypothetical protein
LGAFDFLKGSGQRPRGGSTPPINKENRSYDQLLDEIMEWNITHTDILSMLRSEVEEGRLKSWSQALGTGVRKGLSSGSGKVEEGPLYSVFIDLYQFIKNLRPKLLTNPTMKYVKKMEKMDSLSACIICGIRALQKERGDTRLLNTLHWILLERYLG